MLNPSPHILGSPSEQAPASSRAQPELVPILRDDSWPLLSRVVHRRLIPHSSSGPWLTFAMDYGDSLVFLDPLRTVGTPVPDLERRALQNLARAELSLEAIRPGMVRVSGEFASETLLLPEVLTRVHRMIGTPLLAVAAPKEGGFLAVDAGNVQDVSILISWSDRTFHEARGRRICELPLIVHEGKIVGLAQHEREGA